MNRVRTLCCVLMTTALVLGRIAPAAEHDQEEWFIIPKNYSPEKSWPLIVVSQNQCSAKAMEPLPYFAAYAGSEGARTAILETAGKYNIDPFRIYATGFSRSGHGLLEFTWVRPDAYAAIAPVCEDLRFKEQYGKRQKRDLLKYIQNTPTYLWHGDHDSFLATGKENYELMKAAGCPVQFATFPGGHGPDPLYFNDMKKLTDLFDKHVLDPYPRSITKVIDRSGATRAFWVDARVSKAGLAKDAAEYPVYKVQVKDGNAIDVEANEPILQMTFYLNGKLVDMAKPVTITVNGKEAFKGAASEALSVKLRDGDTDPGKSDRPLWEELEAIRTQPSETGAMDWVYVDLNTRFPDARLGKPMPRRVSLDIGLRLADGPKEAKTVPTSGKFEALDLTDPKAAGAYSFAALERKLPVEAAISVRPFGLAGSVDDPAGAEPAKWTPAGEGKSGEGVVVKVRLTNKGDKEIAGTVKLYRTPFLCYPIGQWPTKGESCDFAAGVREQAGTRGVTWQYFKESLGNWAYQTIGILMLDGGGLPPVEPLTLKQGQYGNTFYGVQRPVTLKGGASVELPLLLISIPASDAKAAKPKVPALDGILRQIKADLLR